MARTEFANRTVAMLCREMGVTQQETQLIRLYAAREQNPKAWEELYRSITMETADFPLNYMLARLAARFDWNCVPEDLVPRLKGVRKYFLVRNVALLSRATKVLAALAEAGVPLLVVKGGALRMGLLPDIPQKMADVDVVVPKERFDECRELLAERGFGVEGYWSHSVDVSDAQGNCVDVHWCVFKNNMHGEEPTQLIVERGTQVTSHGVTVSVPSPEDAFLKTVANAADNFILVQNGKGPISWLADCIDLSECYELSYPDVVDHALEYGALPELRLGLALARHLVPGIFPELEELVGSSVDERTFRRIRAAQKRFAVSDEEFTAYPAPRHLLHAFRLIYHENACSYHLGDPAPKVISSYVGLLSDRLRNYDNIEHVWEIPGLVARRAEVWAERRREASGNDVQD